MWPFLTLVLMLIYVTDELAQAFGSVLMTGGKVTTTLIKLVAQVFGITPPKRLARRIRSRAGRITTTTRNTIVAVTILYMVLLVAFVAVIAMNKESYIIALGLSLAGSLALLFFAIKGVGDVFKAKSPWGTFWGNAAMIPVVIILWHYLLTFGKGRFGWQWGIILVVWYACVCLWKMMSEIKGWPGGMASYVHFGTALFAVVVGGLFLAFPSDTRALEANYALHNTEAARAAVANEIKAMGPEERVVKLTKVYTGDFDEDGKLVGIDPVQVKTASGSTVIWHLQYGERFLTYTPTADTLEVESIRYMKIRLLDPDGDPLPETWLIRADSTTADKAQNFVSTIDVPETSWAESVWDGYEGRETLAPAHSYFSAVGFVTYRFHSARSGDATLAATLSSELPNTTSGSFGKVSDVTIVVNGVEVATITVIPDDARGHTYKVPVTLVSGQNEVKFEVKGGKNANGLAIYGPVRCLFQ